MKKSVIEEGSKEMRRTSSTTKGEGEQVVARWVSRPLLAFHPATYFLEVAVAVVAVVVVE